VATTGSLPAAARALAFVVAIGSVACSDDELPEGPRPQSDVRVLGYNVKGHRTLGSEPTLSANIAAQVARNAPALIAFSECAPCRALVDQLPGYDLVTGDQAGVTGAYDGSLWRAGDHGFLTLGGNDDGWGARVALWVEFEEISSGAPLLFYSTHWCVTVRRPDDACDADRHLEYAQRILDDASGRAAEATPVVVAGDLNAVEGRDGDVVLAAFAGAGYVDALRAIQADGAIVTLDGGERVDYIFASAPVAVIDGYVDESVPFDQASDHRPVIATLAFP